MHRCCSALLTTFRVLQFLLSLMALGCASYLLSQMMALSDYAQDLEATLDYAANFTASGDSNQEPEDVNDGIKTIQKVFKPVLEFLQGTPARAITITVVSAWSVSVIIYMFIAHRRGQKNREKASRANKRWFRVLLEFITLLAWVAGLVCAVLLALQFGVLAILGGGPHALLIKKAINRIVKDQLLDSNDKSNSVGDRGGSISSSINQTLDIIDTLIYIGIASILAAISSVFCGAISLVSTVVACCVSGKARKSKASSEKPVYRDERDYLVHGQPTTMSPASPPMTYSPHSPKSNVTSVTVVMPPTPTHY